MTPFNPVSLVHADACDERLTYGQYMRIYRNVAARRTTEIYVALTRRGRGDVAGSLID